jgi:hypothetical protein
VTILELGSEVTLNLLDVQLRHESSSSNAVAGWERGSGTFLREALPMRSRI